MKRRSLIVAAILMPSIATTAHSDSSFESSKLSAGVVTEGAGFQSPKVSPGIVMQNNAFQSSKITSGIVVANTTFQSSKLSVGIVVEVLPVGTGVVRAPLTHW